MPCVWVVLLSCREAEPPPEQPQRALPTLTAALEGHDLIVSPGSYAYFDYLDCCERPELCLLNNPSSAYGYVTLGPAPGQTAEDLEDGRWFHLRRDEAVIVAGQGPPVARYFSFRSYLALRPTSEGNPLVLGSLGRSTSHLTMAEQRSSPIWGEPMAFVVSASAEAEALAVQGLLDAGFRRSDIYLDRIPEEIVRLGLDREADLFSVTARLAVFADPDAGASHLADPEAVALRVTPRDPIDPLTPHPIEELPAAGSGTDESAWASALDELEAALRARFAGRPALMGLSEGLAVNSLDCIASMSCGGDSTDRYYAYLPPSVLLPGGDVFAVVFGVNHQRTGKASYANFSVDTDLHLLGIGAIDSDAMVGSASPYLPDHPQRYDLYAAIVSRDCSLHEGLCLEIPSTCPGVPEEEPLTISFRAYLEPSTGAAPLEEELLPDRVLWFGAAP